MNYYIYPASETVNLLFGRILSSLATWSRSQMFYPCIYIGVVNTLDWVTEILDALIKFFYSTPDSAGVRNLPANAGNAGDAGSIPGLGRSPGVGNGNPLQYSCLENSVDRGACSPWGHKESDMTERLSSRVCAHTHSKENLRFNLQLLK